MIIAVVVLKSCGILDFGSQYGNDYGSGTVLTEVPTQTASPAKTPAPAAVKTPTPTVAPTSNPSPSTAPVKTPTPASTQQTQSASTSGSYSDSAYSGGDLLSALAQAFTGSYSTNSWYSQNTAPTTAYGSTGGYSSQSSTSSGSSGSSQSTSAASVFGGHSNLNTSAYSSSGWTGGSNCGQLDTTVASGSRSKYTTLKGNGNDTVTVMVYMCGTDLESNYSMGTSDLQEMASATISDKVNWLVYTGGCTGWKNSLMSNKTNQIYKIESGGSFRCLESDAGNKAMVTPSTLSEYIRYCKKNYPADRYFLIFWDHGGGSLSGYGYDQRFKSSGSMSLDGIDEALADGGVYFDFIGFDACLMATVETAQVCAKYADYLVASEESEPGIGWYYTNWVTMLSKNTSVSTLELGKQIVDDFVDVCAKKCSGQDTTLSLTDLAEFSNTVPTALKAWAADTTGLISTDYKTVSSARGSSKEFAESSQIDQVDLTHMALKLDTDASKTLSEALLGAVKYNRTSSTVKNAYGLSIYFPYRSSQVKTAVSTYNEIGFDSDYSECIRNFANYSSSGQTAAYSSSGYSSLFDTLLGGMSDYSSYSGSSSGSSSYSNSGYGSSSSYGSLFGSSSGYGYGSGSSSYGSGYEDLYSLFSSLMGGGRSTPSAGERAIPASTGDSTADDLDDSHVRALADYVSQNRFDSSALVWNRGADGKLSLDLPEDQWNLLSEVKLSLFKDTGDGFADLGLDLYDGYFNEDGSLIGEFDGAWLAIDGWTVAYYQLFTNVEADGTVVTAGRVPVLYNGQRANLIIETVNDEPAVVGVVYDYVNGETETQAKTVTDYSASDTVTFVADFYDYENNYTASYAISDELTVGSDGLQAEYLYLADPASANACYRLTDIYAAEYWTPVMENAA